ncbi:MAG: DUF2442 domain-containing protein [Spirochaetota bacterium]
MVFLVSARYVDGFRVHLCFDSGEEAVVDLHDAVFSYEAARPLRSPEIFAHFHLTSWPTLAWDCGFDLAPEYLYELATGKKPAWAE